MTEKWTQEENTHDHAQVHACSTQILHICIIFNQINQLFFIVKVKSKQLSHICQEKKQLILYFNQFT